MKSFEFVASKYSADCIDKIYETYFSKRGAA